MINSDFDVEKAGPHVTCRIHGTCRMSCTSSCNTMIPVKHKDDAWAKHWKEKYAKAATATNASASIAGSYAELPESLELLPCPHCGSAATYNLIGTTEWVACTACDAQTPHFFTHGQKCNGAPQKQQYGSNPAVKLWNMTAPSCYEQMPAAT